MGLYDVKMADKGNLFIRMDAGGNKTASAMLRNLRNPASPLMVMEIIELAKPVLEYPVKRVEMLLPVEYVET
jgi:hypothetical protein